MSIVSAYVVPHPPLIIPSIGRGQEQEISHTISAFEEIAHQVSHDAVDTLVVISPHAPAFRDGFFISRTEVEQGTMARFGQPQEALSTHTDLQFAELLTQKLMHHGIPVADASEDMSEIDHGTFIPLYFLRNAMDLDQVQVVRIGLSGLSDMDHQLVGTQIERVANELDRRITIIASGDWSHKLTEDGPYGFVPEGPAFDASLKGIFESGNLAELFELDDALCENAAECGLRSFQIMAGALEGTAFECDLLSYEGPFGVGYGVAAIHVLDAPGDSSEEVEQEAERFGFDPLVALARETVESYIKNGSAPIVPADMPQEYKKRKAGVFVSLHEHHDLRGCIGTIEPQRDSIAEEVIANAISASTADPRFPAVKSDELDYLEYSVDVLGIPEPVESLIQLDPKRYGVIVSHGWKRGLLLPNLEGVDTVSDQIAIAKRKAGIAPDEDAKIERFEVVRHSAGGAPRCD